MKLTPDSVKYLKTLLQTVSIVKIDRIIIEDGTIRGIDEDQTALIISQTDVPDFGGARVGLNRLSSLVTRINMFDSNEDFQVDATVQASRTEEGKEDVSSFKISSKGSKFEYRCARPDAIKAPKRINDTMAWKITIPVDAVKIAISAANTMGCDQVAIVSKTNGEVFFEMIDGSTQDTFLTQIASEAEYIGGEDEAPTQSFVHYFAVKALMPLLKACAVTHEPKLEVGEEGMLQITVNNHTFTLLPRESE